MDDKVDERTTTITVRRIKGYEFTEFTIGLAARLRARVKSCGIRSIRTILEVVNESFGDKLFDKIPSGQVIEDWCEKAGLDVHTGARDELAEDDYVMIEDESISVGKQKLLVQLAVPAKHPGRPLRQSDVSVVGMSVSPSWTADGVRRENENTVRSMGRAPKYSISDNGGNLCKAFAKSGIPHHRDISHTLGNILKKHFADSPDFKEFTELMEKKRLEYHLTDKAAILPPKQRATARFMNCSGWAERCRDLLEVYERLPDREKEAGAFIKEHEGLIMELAAITDCMKFVEYKCKHYGLSLFLARLLVMHITKSLVTAKGRTERMLKSGIDMFCYIKDECRLLTSEDDVHIISSDVIESCFGVFKYTKSPDKLCGVTSHVLTLPLALKFTSRQYRMSFDFKSACERVHYADIKEWKELKLYGNPAMERRRLLRKVE